MNASQAEVVATGDHDPAFATGLTVSKGKQSVSPEKANPTITVEDDAYHIVKGPAETQADRSYEKARATSGPQHTITGLPADTLTTAWTVAEPTLIGSSNQGSSAKWLEEASDKYRRLAKLHDKFFRVLTRLKSERDAINPKFQNLDVALNELSRVLEALVDHENAKFDYKIWKSACDRFDAGRQSFTEQIQAVDNQEQRLESVLEKLARLEPEILQAMDYYFKNARYTDNDASATSSSRSRSPPPVLQTRSPSPGAHDFDAPPYLPQSREGILPAFLRDIPWSEKRERLGPFIEDLVKLDGKRELIEDWVGKIPLSKGGLAPEPVEFEHEISSAKSEPEWAYVQFTGDITGDYVLVDANPEFAPNGDPQEPQPPSLLKRMLRRVVSDSALNAGFGEVSKPSSRGSRQMYRNTEAD